LKIADNFAKLSTSFDLEQHPLKFQKVKETVASSYRLGPNQLDAIFRDHPALAPFAKAAAPQSLLMISMLHQIPSEP